MRRKLRLPLASCLALLSLGLLGNALSDDQQAEGQQAEGQQGPAPQRQFDFWVGEWECRTPGGQLAGTNTIRLECGDLVLRESWRGAGGSVGTSLNIYDKQRGKWHQTWTDNSGGLLLLDGGLDDEGAMVLEGDRPGKLEGTTAHHRIRWTPLEPDRVRQTWDVTTDGGASWKLLADLIYTPK